MNEENGDFGRIGNGERPSSSPEYDEDRTIGNYTFDITFEREARAGSNMDASAHVSPGEPRRDKWWHDIVHSGRTSSFTKRLDASYPIPTIDNLRRRRF